MLGRNSLLALVVVLGLLDVVLPVPILALVLIVVIVERPAWFLRAVENIYGGRFERR